MYCSADEEEGEEETAVLPGPVSLEEGRVVDNGGQQCRESPEQQSGEELGDDGILSQRKEERRNHFMSAFKPYPALLKICSV